MTLAILAWIWTAGVAAISVARTSERSTAAAAGWRDDERPSARPSRARLSL